MLTVSIAPDDVDEYRSAVLSSGARLVPPGEQTEVLIWSRHGSPNALRTTLEGLPRLRWVQLPSAGVDDFARGGALDPRFVWTSAKGAYARPVAEHALALTLAALRHFTARARAQGWGAQAGQTLYNKRVVIIGAGGIAEEYARLIAPMTTDIVVCRRTPGSVPFAVKTCALSELQYLVDEADVLLVAAPLTDETRGIVSQEIFRRMKPTAVLVNVARGALVVTDDLVNAVRERQIAAAALDVTHPEPLPSGHPLWLLDDVLITPHTADTTAMVVPLLAARIHDNLARFSAGEPLTGVIDPKRGY